MPDGSELSAYDGIVRVQARSSHVDDHGAADSTHSNVGGWYMGTRCYRSPESLSCELERYGLRVVHQTEGDFAGSGNLVAVLAESALQINL